MFVGTQNNSRFCRSILPHVIDIGVPASHHSSRSISQFKRSWAFTSQSSRASSECPLLGSRTYPQKLPAGGRPRMSRVPYRLLSTQSPINEATQNEMMLCVESMETGEPTIHALFEKNTGTWQYIVADAVSSSAVIIDPVLDYDRTTQTISTQSADSMLEIIKKRNYSIVMILETHVHADHMTAASYLQSKLAQGQGIKPPIGIGKRMTQIQNLFGQRYGVPETEYQSAFGKLFDDDENFQIGQLTATAIHLPGHTPDHLGYRVGDNVFCGDSISHADIGTARCDFPGGSAHELFQSGKKLLGFPNQLKIWTGHDYPPSGREVPRPWMSVQEHRQYNKHLMDGITLSEYVFLREERDAQMPEPKLLHQSLQMNIRAGRLPEPTNSGHRMLHLPIKFQNEGGYES